MNLIDLVKRAKETGDYQLMIEAIPYARFLGISMDSSSGELIGKLGFADHLIGNPVLPALHGGTIGALLESTAIFQLMWEAESVILPKTINVTIDYLRSGRPVDTYAQGVITKQGRRVASVRVEAWQDDRARPIASAYAHFLIKPADA